MIKETVKTTKTVINDKDTNTGDCFSEVSHFVLTSKGKDAWDFTHVESGKEVTLEPAYVKAHMVCAEQYNEEVKVGKEDKYWTPKQLEDAVKKGTLKEGLTRVGDLRLPGIKSLFDSISGQEVFSCCYQKRSEPLTKKEYNLLRTTQIEDALSTIEKAAKNKTGVAAAAKTVLQTVQDNPIFEFKEGEMREFRGYKLQHSSEDGFYDCHDMNIRDGSPVRSVNINTLEWLIYKGVRYVVE